MAWAWLQMPFIYMNLYNFYDVQTIIRVGSCGGIHKDLNVGDIVAATTAHTDNAMTKRFYWWYILSICY